MELFDITKLEKAIKGLYIPSCEAVILAIVIAIIPVSVGYYIYHRQEKIVKEQLKIANKQNEIALFDKRYVIFSDVERFSVNLNIVLAHSNLEYYSKNEHIFEMLFNKIEIQEKCSYSEKSDYIIAQLNRIHLLFSLKDKDKKIIKEIKEVILSLQIDIMQLELKNLTSPEDAKQKIEDFINFFYKNTNREKYLNLSLLDKINLLSQIIKQANLCEILKQQIDTNK